MDPLVGALISCSFMFYLLGQHKSGACQLQDTVSSLTNNLYNCVNRNIGNRDTISGHSLIRFKHYSKCVKDLYQHIMSWHLFSNQASLALTCHGSKPGVVAVLKTPTQARGQMEVILGEECDTGSGFLCQRDSCDIQIIQSGRSF